jgi:arylsulfatase A-like enzyme
MGKWHCGYLPWFSPTRLGWDEFFGNFAGGLDYFSKINTNGDHDLYEDEVEIEDLRYYTHIITERATEFLQRRHDAPWLLNLNFTTPHWPWEGPGDKAVSDELTARIEAGEPGVLFHNDGGSLETYREMVEDLDRSVGKGQVLEGGIRIPTLLSWPGKLRRRQVSHEPVVTMDWTATFLELAGAQPGPRYPLDGASFADHLFRGTRAPRHDRFWRMRGERALRRGNLKYVQLADGVDHLYDLDADLRKQADLGHSRPDDLAALRSAWEAVNAELLRY